MTAGIWWELHVGRMRPREVDPTQYCYDIPREKIKNANRFSLDLRSSGGASQTFGGPTLPVVDIVVSSSPYVCTYLPMLP